MMTPVAHLGVLEVVPDRKTCETQLGHQSEDGGMSRGGRPPAQIR